MAGTEHLDDSVGLNDLWAFLTHKDVGEALYTACNMGKRTIYDKGHHFGMFCTHHDQRAYPKIVYMLRFEGQDYPQTGLF